GPPGAIVTRNCGPFDNEILKPQLVTDAVANFKVTMLKPALASLKEIFSEIRKNEPNLLKNVVSEGALCVRYERGTTRLSSHSYGTAVDLSFAGASLVSLAPSRADVEVQRKAARYFQNAQWLWRGTATIDYLHFEVGPALLDSWIASGEL